MAATEETFSARSLLFAPGDSDRKMEKAAASTADIALLDLEDAVTEDAKPKARAMISAFLEAQQPTARQRLWVRINPLDGPHALADLAAVIPARPGGILLPKSRGRGDVERLDHYLSALEVSAGAEQGSTKIIALAIETAESMFTVGTYQGAPRLVAMTWGAEDLAGRGGRQREPQPRRQLRLHLSSSPGACACWARPPPASPPSTPSTATSVTLTDLRRRAEQVRRAGFRGMLAIHPAQVDVINAAFTPTAEELAEAQEIVDLFAANPGVGAIGLKGAMLDRPHLARAQALLATRPAS